MPPERLCLDCKKPIVNAPAAAPRCSACYRKMLDSVGVERTCCLCGFELRIAPDSKIAKVPPADFVCRRCDHADRVRDIECKGCRAYFDLPSQLAAQLDLTRAYCPQCRAKQREERDEHVAGRERRDFESARVRAQRSW